MIIDFKFYILIHLLLARLRYLLTMGRLFSFIVGINMLIQLGIGSVYAQGIKPKIQTAYQQFIKNPALLSGIGSLTVLNAKTGEVVFEGNNQFGLPTASTLKVITSITALDLLGEDYTFQTHLYYTGEVDSLGILNGDIIIEGTGDPTLGSDRYPETNASAILEKWKAEIIKLGIKHINGRIIADDGLYNGYDVPSTWMWGDIGNYYGAGTSALNWKENKKGINFTPGKTGQPATINEDLSTTAYTIINEVKTGTVGSGDKVYGYSAPYSNTIYLRGTYGSDLKKTIEISVPDPAFELINDLSNLLAKDSILVQDTLITAKKLKDENPTYKTPTDKKLLLTIKSPKLGEIVYWFNQKSINLYGEALLKEVGRISANKTDPEESASLISKYWQNKLKIPTNEINSFDGSGLSPQNRVTTNAMAKIMQYARERAWFATFLKSLPSINGTSMKSGTIGGVLGYTGYQKAADGQEYTFSLLVNNYQGSSTTMRQNMFNLLNVLK